MITCYLGEQHIKDKKWLAASHHGDMAGGWCIACVLFGTTGEAGNGGTTPLGALVTKPLTKFDSLTGVKGALTGHAEKKYHLANMKRMNDFLKY